MGLPKNKYMFFIAIIIGLFFVIWSCSCKVEKFQGWQGQTPRPVPAATVVNDDEIDALKKKLEERFDTVSKQLCPSFNIVMTEIAKTKESAATQEEKEKAAIVQMSAEAGGKIYDCRSYPDHLQIPADIGPIVAKTATYLYKKLTKLVENVKVALSCKTPPMENYIDYHLGNSPEKSEMHYSNVVEYYEDICSPESMTVRKKLAEEEKKKAEAGSCTAPDEIDNTRKKQLLEMRIKSLENVVMDPSWGPVVEKIREAVEYFIETKRKIDAGTLVPDCGDGGMKPVGFEPVV